LPADAKYYIAEGNATLARRKTRVKEALVVNGQIQLNSFAGLMQPGDRIIVEVVKVKRINFRNESEDVSMPRYYETIILN
jgi:hypothetical protein